MSSVIVDRYVFLMNRKADFVLSTLAAVAEKGSIIRNIARMLG